MMVDVFGRVLLENAMKDLIILKSNRPKRMIQIQNRLNNKIKHISAFIVVKIMEDPFFKPQYCLWEIEKMYGTSLKEVFMVGIHELTKKQDILWDVPLISPSKLDEIVNERVFRASEATMQRLTGQVLPYIQEGVREGRILGKTVQSLKKDFVDMTNHELTRIARTETHSVYNQSKLEPMLQAGVSLGKMWVSSGLSNSRSAHEDADGQVVGADEPFIVGGEELMYPGDPAGSPENVINCSCTFVPVIDYQKNK